LSYSHQSTAKSTANIWSLDDLNNSEPQYDEFLSDPLASIMQFLDEHKNPDDPGAHYFKLFHDHDDTKNIFSNTTHIGGSRKKEKVDKFNKQCRQLRPNDAYLSMSKDIQQHFRSEMSVRKLNNMHFTGWQAELIDALDDLQQRRVNHDNAGMLVTLRELYLHDLIMDDIYAAHEPWQGEAPEKYQPIPVTIKHVLDVPQKSEKLRAHFVGHTPGNQLVIIQVNRPHDQVWRQLLKHEQTFILKSGIIARTNNGFTFMKIRNPQFWDQG